MRYVPLTTALLVMALAGCATPDSSARSDAEPDPRQGERVSQLCFTQGINGWSEAPGMRDAIILTKGVRDRYLVTTSGVCDVDDAFYQIGFQERFGSSCLSRGDKIYTDATFSVGACYIREIYEWNEDAVEDETDVDDAQSDTDIDDDSL